MQPFVLQFLVMEQNGKQYFKWLFFGFYFGFQLGISKNSIISFSQDKLKTKNSYHTDTMHFSYFNGPEDGILVLVTISFLPYITGILSLSFFFSK